MKYREGNNCVGDYGLCYTHLDVYYQTMQCSFEKAWEQCYKRNMQATNHCETWKCFVVCQDIGNTWSNLLDVHSSLWICQFQEQKQNSIPRFSFSKLDLNCFLCDSRLSGSSSDIDALDWTGYRRIGSFFDDIFFFYTGLCASGCFPERRAFLLAILITFRILVIILSDHVCCREQTEGILLYQ